MEDTRITDKSSKNSSSDKIGILIMYVLEKAKQKNKHSLHRNVDV